jgi:glycosyltransferase involved in cell wall biosynthesis
VDPYPISRDPWVYRHYLSTSLGEWSVAKHAYVASRSGWFSCRSACYLALGVPVVVQDTGFGCAIPIGRGVLPFGTMEEAVDAIERLVADPAGHAEAALAIAREYFDSDRVLSRLIDQAAGHG